MNICCQENNKINKKIEESVDLLKAVSEPNRLRILCVLSKEKICVCDLAEKLGIQQNLLSFHLKTLFEVGILEKFREGNSIYYAIKKEWEKKIESIFKFLDIK
jgi:ArsR family transcriptional regulator, lead/cadmium/zinc/bismuth-responsive transcriptional repressor